MNEVINDRMVDVKEDITIGLHLPVTVNTRVTLDGDGAIVVTGDVQKPSSVAAFRPTSIQGEIGTIKR